jgi:hypothetical protein
MGFGIFVVLSAFFFGLAGRKATAASVKESTSPSRGLNEAVLTDALGLMFRKRLCGRYGFPPHG